MKIDLTAGKVLALTLRVVGGAFGLVVAYAIVALLYEGVTWWDATPYDGTGDWPTGISLLLSGALSLILFFACNAVADSITNPRPSDDD